MSARSYHSPQRPLVTSFVFGRSVARVPSGTSQSTGGLADAPPRIAHVVAAALRRADDRGHTDRTDRRLLTSPDEIEHPSLGSRVHVLQPLLRHAFGPSP